MQRSICRVAGACGLIFTFTIAANGASGGVAAVGGGATAGGAATATAPIGAANGGRTAASGTAVQGQGVSTIPGQSLSVAPPTTGAQGQPTPSTPASAGSTLSAPNSATTSTPQTTGTLGNPTAGSALSTTPAATTTGVGASAIGTTSAVPFSNLPAAIQSQIAAQLPVGAQLGNIVAETTPQGIVYRAQVLQNGVLSEMALSGIGAAGSAVTGAANGTSTGTITTGLIPGTTVGTDGFVVGTPYSYAQLPTPVQTAFAAQGGTGATNIMWAPTGNGGGIFHAMVDGKPVDIRVAGNGQVIPSPIRNVARTSNTTTNAMTIEDLPVSVRDAIRNTAPYAEITRINKTKTASGDVYDITMRANDHLTMMQVSDTGAIIKENEDIVAAVNASNVVLTNEPPKLAWNSLPPAVRDSIEVNTQPSTVKTLVLTNHLGKTAYVVDYVDKDALRNRLYINKQGLVVDTQTNLYGIALTGKPVVIDDLPAPARDAVQEKAENSAVTRIDLAMYGLTPVYVVTYQHDGEARQMVVSRDGKRFESSIGAPATTVIGSEKGVNESNSKAAEPQK